MQKRVLILLIVFTLSCAEKLLEKPENLIPKDKMVKILNDLAILNAAKTTNIAVLKQNGVEPMQFIYTKYGVDSLQFVESDRYYASLPEIHEEIYIAVEAKLQSETDRLTLEKKEQDSLKRIEKKLKAEKAKLKDSLP